MAKSVHGSGSGRVRQALVPVTKHAATMARMDEEKYRTAARLPQTITQLASCTTGGSLAGLYHEWRRPTNTLPRRLGSLVCGVYSSNAALKVPSTSLSTSSVIPIRVGIGDVVLGEVSDGCESDNGSQSRASGKSGCADAGGGGGRYAKPQVGTDASTCGPHGVEQASVLALPCALEANMCAYFTRLVGRCVLEPAGLDCAARATHSGNLKQELLLEVVEEVVIKYCKSIWCPKNGAHNGTSVTRQTRLPTQRPRHSTSGSAERELHDARRSV